MDNSIINENLIKLNLTGSTKDEVIQELTDLIFKNGNLNSKEDFIKEVKNRESQFTTGIGNGLAIPHGKCNAVIKPCVAFGKSASGIDWNSMDNEPAHLVFLIAVPSSGASDQHLKILSTLSRKLIHEEFRESLFNTKEKIQLLSLLKSAFEVG